MSELLFWLGWGGGSFLHLFVPKMIVINALSIGGRDNNNNNNNNKNIYLPPKHTVLQVWFFTIFLRYLTAD